MNLQSKLINRHNIEVAVFLAGALLNLFLVASIFAMVWFNGQKIQNNADIIKANQKAILSMSKDLPGYNIVVEGAPIIVPVQKEDDP